jgi:hypothetical protein
MQQEKPRQHGTRAATASAAGPPEAAAALATGVGVPTRTSSSPGRILASSADLVGPDETSRVSFNEVDVAAFDAVAEIAARDAEGLPTLLAESERQRISQDVAAKDVSNQIFFQNFPIKSSACGPIHPACVPLGGRTPRCPK